MAVSGRQTAVGYGGGRRRRAAATRRPAMLLAILALSLPLVLAERAAGADGASAGAGTTARSLLAGAVSLSAGAGRERLVSQPVLAAIELAAAGEKTGRAPDGAEWAVGSDLIASGAMVVRLRPGHPGKEVAEPGTRAMPAFPLPVAAAPWIEPAPDDPFTDVRVVFLTADGAEALAAALAAWRALPDVAWAEPYHIHRTTAVPDDPLFPVQGHLAAVGAPGAWDNARGAWRPWTVAVVDAGFDPAHEDLAANLLLNHDDPPNGLDDDGNGLVDDHRGWNFAAGSDQLDAFASTTPASIAHGTHVAGIVGAVTDNGRGVAGVTWNGPVLAVAVGDPGRELQVVFGYQGIVYAVRRGAKIINCSWGRALNSSLLEREVIDHAAAHGAIVIAAAGNEGNAFPFYPAAYPGVFAVAAVNDDGQRHASSGYGPWVSLAAPGVEVLSLLPGGTTGRMTGTSMAAPVVAGAAALIWGDSPGDGGEAALVRLQAASAPAAVGAGDGDAGIGAGVLDVASALAYPGPGYRIVTVRHDGGEPDGCLLPGQTVALWPRWRNVLADGRGPVTVRVSTSSPHAVVLAGETTLPPLPAGLHGEVREPLLLSVAADAPVGALIPLTWTLAGPSDPGGLRRPWYQDRQVTELSVSRLFVDLAEGELRLTLGGNGRLGFTGRGGGNGGDGRGVRYIPAGSLEGEGAGGNLLFEGALLLGTGPQRLSDAARYSSLGAFLPVFRPASPQQAPRALPPLGLPGGRRLARAAAVFEDSPVDPPHTHAPLPVRVRWVALAPLDADPPGTALLLVAVINTGHETLAGLRYGMFLDWDLPPAARNTTVYNPQTRTAAVFAAERPDGLTVAASLVPEGDEASHFRAIANEGGQPEGAWGIYDGFTKLEKWQALSDPAGPQAVLSRDVSQVLAAGPVQLAPGDSARFVLVLAAGHDQRQALANAAAGRRLADEVLSAPAAAPLPAFFWAGLPDPNPGNGGVGVAVAGNPLVPWRLLVYDLRGRLVRAQPSRLLPGGGRLEWDGRADNGRSAASGSYILRIEHGAAAAARKVTLVR